MGRRPVGTTFMITISSAMSDSHLSPSADQTSIMNRPASMIEISP